MPENDKTGIEEETISLHYIQDDQKDKREKHDVPGTPVKCSNGLEASGKMLVC